MDRVDFVVTGFHRSGTGYMSRLFTGLGYPIGHEAMGPYGISSWTWAVDSTCTPYGPPRNGCGQDHLIHVVRDPWAVISSIVTNGIMRDIHANRYISRYVSDRPSESDLVRATRFVIGWNRIVRDLDPDLVVQVERAATVVPDWLLGNGYDIPANFVLPPSDYNTRKTSRRLPPDRVYSLPPGLRRGLNEHADIYGYRRPG